MSAFLKVLQVSVVFAVMLSGCGSDSKTNGSGQTDSSQGTYINQCTLHKKVTNTDTGNTKDFTWFVRRAMWIPLVNGEPADSYQYESYDTDATGKRLPDAKISYVAGDYKTREKSDTLSESTDTSYSTDSNFNRTDAKTYKVVDLWRSDSKTQRTLISHSLNGELQNLDIVGTTEVVDDSTWIHSYRYPTPGQMSSGNQHVLEYSKTCVETYQTGRIE